MIPTALSKWFRRVRVTETPFIHRVLFVVLLVFVTSYERLSSSANKPQREANAFVATESPTIGIVVSWCNEPNEAHATLRAYEHELRQLFSVNVWHYCKCSSRDECVEILPNIGREGHTFLHHVASRYNSSLDDLTVFVNGGFLAKTYTRDALRRVFVRLENLRRARWTSDFVLTNVFADQEILVWDEPVEIAERASFSTSHCMQSVRQFCADDSAHRCRHKFSCAKGQTCGCDAHTSCAWSGSTTENRNDVLTTLPPTSVRAEDNLGLNVANNNMYTWTCSRTSIDPSTIHSCGTTYGAVFAVGKARIRARDADFYLELKNELETYGVTGGMMSHYMERLYRTLFYCSISSLWRRRASDPTFVIKWKGFAELDWAFHAHA